MGAGMKESNCDMQFPTFYVLPHSFFCPTPALPLNPSMILTQPSPRILVPTHMRDYLIAFLQVAIHPTEKIW